jgi:hypothetical protein
LSAACRAARPLTIGRLDLGMSEPKPSLTPEAQRALAEAEARRRDWKNPELPAEHGGPSGPEPTRYGDWSIKGIVSDF